MANKPPRRNAVTRSVNSVTLSLSKGLGLVWRWGPAIAWMALIFWINGKSVRPPTPGMTSVPWDDKLQHTVAYAILAALMWRALGRGRGRWVRAGIALVVASAYGLTDECHQMFVPGRSCSLTDWICDTSGAVAAITVLLVASTRIGGDHLGE